MLVGYWFGYQRSKRPVKNYLANLPVKQLELGSLFITSMTALVYACVFDLMEAKTGFFGIALTLKKET